MRALRNVGRLVSAGEPVRENVEVILDGEVIKAVRPRGEAEATEDDHDCRGLLLTAGFIDAHAHPLYPEPRLDEVAERAAGASYAAIAERGGGINATVRSAREVGVAALEEPLRGRLRRWLEQGTTTMEAKTGYFLEMAAEVEGVGLLRRLDAEEGVPSLIVTFLGAHEVPPERRSDRARFLAEVGGAAAAARAAGADFCDVFCDQGAFTVEEAERVLEAGRAAGLKLRIHADELALTGGSRLAARERATSADHLLRIGAAEISALAAAGTVATLCPVTAVSMGQLPPSRQLLEAGVPIALGSDHNPGTSGTTSMSLVVYLAVTQLGLTVAEAVGAATWGGARSLALADRGRVVPGQRADLVLWQSPHEGAFAWEPGLRPAAVWKAGRLQS